MTDAHDVFVGDFRMRTSKILPFKERCHLENQTKRSLIEPIFDLLGYVTFNPAHVQLEYAADVAGRKGEKVDYALYTNSNAQPSIIVEAKHWTENLDRHTGQLERYFPHVHSAPFAILTNGIEYRFYTDSDRKNIMDEKPFLSFSIDDTNSMTEQDFALLELFHRDHFDADAIRDIIKEKRLSATIARFLDANVFVKQSDSFLKFLTKELENTQARATVDIYRPIVRRIINDKLNSTPAQQTPEPQTPTPQTPAPQKSTPQPPEGVKVSNPNTTTSASPVPSPYRTYSSTQNTTPVTAKSSLSSSGRSYEVFYMTHNSMAEKAELHAYSKNYFVLPKGTPVNLHGNDDTISYNRKTYGAYIDEHTQCTTADINFTFPSPAASLYSGHSKNGWIEWVNAQGQSLDEVYRQDS